MAEVDPVIEKRDLSALRLLFEHAKEVKPVAAARMAAMIVIKGSNGFIGVNSLKTDPLQARFAKNEEAVHLHAEVAAIKLALRSLGVDDLSKATLYVARAKYSDGKRTKFLWGSAKPCAGCRRAIEEFNIGRVVYTHSSTDEHYEVEERRG